MRWLAVAAIGALTLAGILLTRRRRDLDPADVGAVSDQWIAQQRANVPDAFQ